MTAIPMAGKDPRRNVHDPEELNTGAPPVLLQDPLTPTSLWFTRSHAPVPIVDAASYRLTVTGLVERPLTLTLTELEAIGRQESLATLVCAGLRRVELEAYRPVPGELLWGSEPISTARFSGLPLRRVLERAGVKAGASHVEFIGLDRVERHGEIFGFGGSIPLAKALSDEVILADRMNGAPLAPEHGFPLRAVVPGYYGARSVKWLGQVVVRDAPSVNYFQAQAYRVQRAVDPEHPRSVAQGSPLGEVVLNSAILEPEAGARVKAGTVRLTGWAIAAGGGAPARVEVSADGQAWRAATLTGEGSFAWRHWSLDVMLAAGAHTLAVRAIDHDGAVQPAELAEVWNVKGYANNAWHRVQVTAAD
ncbi:MAG: sulfite oxidase [Gemmatimonadales bacterium]